MAKKHYKHIKLPNQLISAEYDYVPPHRIKIPEKLKFNQDSNRKKLALNMARIRKYYEEREGERSLMDDKGNVDVRIAFRGPYIPKFIQKYNIDIYKVVPGKKDNEVIYGKVSNIKRQGEKSSNFERLQKEIGQYKEKGRFKTYFDFVQNIKPIELKEVIEPDFLSELKKHSQSEYMVDISFGGTKENAQQKIDSIAQNYGDKFISKVNTTNLHYCRLKAKLNELEEIIKVYSEVSKVERSPVYFIETSVVNKPFNKQQIINPPLGLTPAFVFDTDINMNHSTLDGSIDDLLHNDGTDPQHGTAVASLVVCGARITSNGIVQQDNRVVGVKVSGNQFSKLEEIIQQTIEKYAPLYPVIIANLSVNVYEIIYSRQKEVNKLTILLDELAKQYGCIFVISAGNLFAGNWSSALVQKCQGIGYPDYFKEKYTRICPPSDSINNISVGSIVFQESVDSLVKIKSPAVHTRGNLDTFPFIKPDLVNFDSNHKADFTCEENGVFMASMDSNQITSMPGTSFSTPLVTHDLILLHNKYPNLNANSLKALIIHSADKNIGTGIRSKKIREKLIGHGLPDVEKIMYSDNHRSTIIIEDEIIVGKEKTIKFPVPSCIAGSSKKRMRISKTVVYNPAVNGKNPRLYNPIHLFTQLLRSDNADMESKTTRTLYAGAHSKSNVKKYPPVEKSTKEYTGKFWYLKVACENKDELYIPADYKQSYSVVLTIEDITEQEGVDLHQEIQNMIEVETQIRVPVEIIN